MIYTLSLIKWLNCLIFYGGIKQIIFVLLIESRMPQISYRSQSMKLLDKAEFPTFFRTSSNIKKEAQTLVEVIKHFRWTQVRFFNFYSFYFWCTLKMFNVLKQGQILKTKLRKTQKIYIYIMKSEIWMFCSRKNA